MNSGRFFSLVFALLLVLLGGCLGQSRQIPNGFVTTEGIVIAAEDGSFSLMGGSDFTAPFQVDSFNWSDHSCKEFLTFRDDVRNAYKTALALGAKKVKITVPGLDKPLYGVLLLGMYKKDCSGPEIKSYRIEVPQKYIDGALQGRVSVIYEKMSCDFIWKLKGSFSENCFVVKDSWYSWVLWLSDMPIR